MKLLLLLSFPTLLKGMLFSETSDRYYEPMKKQIEEFSPCKMEYVIMLCLLGARAFLNIFFPKITDIRFPCFVKEVA